jgi:hypothetical protein
VADVVIPVARLVRHGALHPQSLMPVPKVELLGPASPDCG